MNTDYICVSLSARRGEKYTCTDVNIDDYLMHIFKFIGVLLACYTVYAGYTGELHAKSGIRWEIITRVDRPRYFWTVLVIYAVLSITLLTLF